MSETAIKSCPPPNEFFVGPEGITLWRAEIDGISIRSAFKSVVVEAFQGDQKISHTISAAHARHLIALLQDAVSLADSK